MGYAEIVAETDLERVEKKLDWQKERQDKLVEAVNGIGLNLQWLIDNAKGIFEMFQSPQFMSALPAMMNPAAMQAAASTMNKDNNAGTADRSAAADQPA